MRGYRPDLPERVAAPERTFALAVGDLTSERNVSERQSQQGGWRDRDDGSIGQTGLGGRERKAEERQTQTGRDRKQRQTSRDRQTEADADRQTERERERQRAERQIEQSK